MNTDRSGPQGFVKIRRRALALAIVKAALIGASAGIACAGVLIILSKIELIDMSLTVAALIGVAVLAVCGVASFFLFHRSDVSLARMLDERFNLKEKVQTMMAYRTREEAIYALQREDAEAEIERIPRRGIRIRFLWIYLVCLVLSACVLVSAVMYTPVEPPPEPVVEVPFEITAIQIAAMEELIEYVSGSEMESPYRENTALAISDLLDELKTATTESERDSALDEALRTIYAETDASSTAVEIIEALWSSGSDTVKLMAVALNYYEWSDGSEWDEYSEALSDLRKGYVHPDSAQESPDHEKMVAETAALLSSDSSAIAVALIRSGAPATDALCSAVTKLATSDGNEEGSTLRGFSALASLAPELGYTALEGELDTAFSAITPILYTAIEQNSINTDTGEYAMRRICDLFDYTLPTFERPVLRDSSSETGDSGSDDTEGGGMGGIGIGTVYGSDDLVLDPYTDEYVEYGTILDKYYSLMFGKTEDGDYTDDEIAALKKYFEILYGGFEEEE